jgi:hypothetical protein
MVYQGLLLLSLYFLFFLNQLGGELRIIFVIIVLVVNNKCCCFRVLYYYFGVDPR